jgi:hypothetical protein
VSENGERYAGYFLSGLREGYGSQIYADLDNYEGRWERDVWNGWGRHSSPQRSEVYEGSFVNGQRHGNGHLQANGRTIYKGEWLLGNRHGEGEGHFQDGSVYEGAYDHGKMHGSGTLTMSEGAKYVGEFQDDKRHGTGVEEWDGFCVWVKYAKGILVTSSLALCPTAKENGKEGSHEEAPARLLHLLSVLERLDTNPNDCRHYRRSISQALEPFPLRGCRGR